MQEYFMKLALMEAKKAFSKGEVPVGAVIIKDGQVLSRAYNKRENCQNAICHAETLAINKACKKLGKAHLEECEMYVTLEPCPMCAGAISASRLKKVCFATSDEKYGCAGSLYNLLQDKNLESLVAIEKGILEKESQHLLKSFFVLARKRNSLKNMLGKEFDENKANIESCVQEKNCCDEESLSNYFSKKFTNFIKRHIKIKEQKDFAYLCLSKGKIVAIVQETGGFGSLIVESSRDVSFEQIESMLKIPFRHKIFVKGGVEIFDKYKE